MKRLQTVNIMAAVLIILNGAVDSAFAQEHQEKPAEAIVRADEADRSTCDPAAADQDCLPETCGEGCTPAGQAGVELRTLGTYRPSGEVVSASERVFTCILPANATLQDHEAWSDCAGQFPDCDRRKWEKGEDGSLVLLCICRNSWLRQSSCFLWGECPEPE